MSFFEPPPPPELPDWAKTPTPRPWWSAPSNELGAPVPVRLVLARTDQVALALIGLTAYTIGVELTLSVRVRQANGRVPSDHDLMGFPFGHLGTSRPTDELPPELLRFGVQFSDGGKATTTGNPMYWRGPNESEEEPRGPVLMPGGGGGGEGVWDSAFWLWPLPPPGTLTFAVEWPKQGIELTKHDVDANLVLEASKQSEVLWPDEGGRGGSISTTMFMLEDVPSEGELP